MGIFNKLMFWKKKEDLGIGPGKELGLDTGLGAGFGQDNLGLGTTDLGLAGAQHQAPQNEPTGFGQNAPFGAQPLAPQPTQTAPPGFQAAPAVPVMPQQPSQQEFTIVSKDIELLSYKLDTLKAALDMVNQRLANIERLANTSQEKRHW